MKHRFSYLCTALAVLAMTQFVAPARAEGTAQTGVAEGVLTAKGDTWIAVRADGEQESTKLMPRWIGGLPKNGGGLDKRMLLLFRELIVGSRLKVAWLRDEHLRVTDIQVLQLPGDGQETQNTDGQHEEAPAQKEGTLTGVVTGKGENWVLIRPDGEHESKKFFPRWIGGLPADGGGFDQDALRAIKEVAVGTKVQVSWIWNEHYRLTAMKPVE